MVRVEERTSLRNRMIHQRLGSLRNIAVSFTRGEAETEHLGVRSKESF